MYFWLTWFIGLNWYVNKIGYSNIVLSHFIKTFIRMNEWIYAFIIILSWEQFKFTRSTHLNNTILFYFAATSNYIYCKVDLVWWSTSSLLTWHCLLVFKLDCWFSKNTSLNVTFFILHLPYCLKSLKSKHCFADKRAAHIQINFTTTWIKYIY